MELLQSLLLLPLMIVASNPKAWSYIEKNFLPPPVEHIRNDPHCLIGPHYSNDSNLNCHGAIFVPANGYFQPCSLHSHCYRSREPTDWCIMPKEYRWTNWGCHCDKKLGSCLIERYHKTSRTLQWGYCTPNHEFYCASRFAHLYHPHGKRRL